MDRKPRWRSQAYDLAKLIRKTPREKLEAMIHGIVVTMWKDGLHFDPNKEWSTEEIEVVADLLESFRPRRRHRDRGTTGRK